MPRLWLIVLLACIFLAATLLLIRSPAILLALAHWSVDTFTEQRLHLKNPVINLGRGIISAEELHLIPRGQSGPALFSVVDLDVTTRLSNLLTGNLKDTLVSASQVLIYVSENDGTRDPDPGTWIQFANWLPSQLYIGQVHLVTAAEDTWIFPLRELQGQRLDENSFRTRALADYDGEPLEVKLDLNGFLQDGGVPTLEVKAGFFALQSKSRIDLTGVIKGRKDRFRYDLKASADYSEIGEFLKGLDTETVLQGRMQIQARMVGDSRKFRLSDAHVLLDNMPAYGFEAAGELEWERGGKSRLQLIASGELDDLGYLVNWVDLDVSDLGRAQASVQLSGSFDHPVVDEFILLTKSDQGLSVNLSGRLAYINQNQSSKTPDTDTENELRVDIHAPSAAALEPWMGELRYDPGPWRASWVTKGNRDAIRLENIVLETGTEQTLIARLEGSVDEIANIAEITPEAISGIELTLNATTDDSRYLADITGLEIPPLLRLHAQGSLNGSGNILDLNGGEITVDGSDLQARISGIVGRYRLGGAQAGFRGISAQVEAEISDTSALAQYTELEVPVLGPAELKATLQQSEERYKLDPMEISISGDELSMTATGSIGNIGQLSDVHMRSHIAHLDIGHLLAFALDKFDYERELGYLRGTFDLADFDGVWQLSRLELETAEREITSPLDITLQGAINDLTGFTTADLETRVSVRETALFEALTGLRARPGSADISIATTPTQLKIAANGQAGTTHIEAAATIEYRDNEISGLSAHIYTPHLHLADVGLQVEEEAPDDYAPGADIDKRLKIGLEGLLDKSPEFPTDIQVDIAGITGRNTNIESLKVDVTGEDNRYTLRRFSLVYGTGTAEIRGVIDLNSTPPSASLAGEALSLPLAELSQDIGAPSDIRGTLTARGGIAAQGVDTASLLVSLSGNVAIALEDTVIQGAAYDLLATDLLAWIYSGAALESSTHLDCTMARFDILQGIARTDTLYIESPRMIATGEGKFDLGRGTMDLTLTPRSRSRSFQIPSKVRLRGDMSNPRASVSPISAAADASAQALLIIPKLALRLFGVGGARSKKGLQPCQAALD